MNRWLKHAIQFDTREEAGRDAHRLGAILADNPFEGLQGTWAFDTRLAAHCWQLGWHKGDRENPQQMQLF